LNVYNEWVKVKNDSLIYFKDIKLKAISILYYLSTVRPIAFCLQECSYELVHLLKISLGHIEYLREYKLFDVSLIPDGKPIYIGKNKLNIIIAKISPSIIISPKCVQFFGGENCKGMIIQINEKLVIHNYHLLKGCN
jgi:hypothetical protein